MLQQVMLDVKLTLFAICLAIGIASPANDGDNVAVYDYVIITIEAPAGDPVAGWCHFGASADNQQPVALAKSTRQNVRPLSPDSQAKVLRGIATLSPLTKPQALEITITVPATRLTVATRGRKHEYTDLPREHKFTVHTK